MNRYDQLIVDLSSDYRPQREWGEGRGVLLVVGHFLVGVAGGTWLMSSIYGVTAGLVVAYLLGGLGGIAHLMFLGHPEHAFKMMRNVRTSWISRGFVGLSLFLVGGGVDLAIILFSLSGPWNAIALLAQIVAAVGTFTIIGYMGFCYTASKAIPFWHSPLHPALYIAFAIRGGIAALLVIGAATGTMASSSLLQLWIAISAIVALFFVFEIQGAWTSGNIAAKWSVRDVLAGRLAMSFYGGTLAMGLIVPVLLLVTSTAHSPVVMALIGIASAAGDFFMKLTMVKAGVYLPLVRRSRR
jgi:formate-dependent nitrite reductase membrane component NrfD